MYAVFLSIQIIIYQTKINDMRKPVLFSFFFAFITTLGFSQTDPFWSANNNDINTMAKEKGVARLSFPKNFKLFDLNTDALRRELLSITGKQAVRHSTFISLPNADGKIETYEVFEASNFDPALQEQFPGIRAFSGRGITDKYAMLKLSISPQGIQTMVFRTDKEDEFMEPYSNDHHVYAVFQSQREKGKLPWTCSTVDTKMAGELNNKITSAGVIGSSTGELKTMRLAQSVTAEYSNYFGATSAAQLPLVLAAINATLTRCNGCYEKDLGVHLNLIPNEAAIIYYDPATDPYSPPGAGAGGAWNGELQANLTLTIGEANYDIGHLFGDSGGGGNAGCIGCICVNGSKGSGFTSPADGIPMGDNFDIDYVVHEVGHQMGANHTFSHNLEGTGVNKEVGAGITIMGYAGITSFDPAPHSIDIYHEASIQQIQNNLAVKTCPVTTNISATNATPIVAAMSNYTIPISTPFALTGAATDANGDPLTYCWEQNDNSTTSGAGSVATQTKTTGPNWLSFSPTASPTRIFPKLSTILAGLFVTPPLPGGDAVCNIEALSAVDRTLNFRLTVRDNHPFSSAIPISVAQTAFTDMTVTVTSSSGPFMVSSPNITPVTWNENTPQTVTWDVNGTTGAPVSCANVKISLSIDGGNTFPYVLAASTANDGSEVITVPYNTTTSNARIKVEAVGNIFFDISDLDFSIAPPLVGFAFPSTVVSSNATCGQNTAVINLGIISNGGYTTPVNLSASANPPGTTVSFSTNPVVPGNTTNITITNISSFTPGTYSLTITGTSGPMIQNKVINFVIDPGTGPAITVQPTQQSGCLGSTASFTITSPAANGYQWQLSVNGGVSYSNLTNNATYSGVTTNTLTITGLLAVMGSFRYRCLAVGQCNSTASDPGLITVYSLPILNQQPASTGTCAGNSASFSVAASGIGVTYQWQVSTDGGVTFNNIIGALSSTLSFVTSLSQNGYQYRCILTGTCSASSITSTAATLAVGGTLVIASQPANVIICEGSSTTFSVGISGTVTYQWQESTNSGSTWNNISNGGIYSGATSANLTLTAVAATANNNLYRCMVSGYCSPVNSLAASLKVNTAPAVTVQPSASIGICSLQNASFSVSATGTALSYQWQLSTDGGISYNNLSNGGVYSNVTTATLNITGATISMNTYKYRCVITGTCSPAATTLASTLSVYTPVSVSANPVNVMICEKSNASFSVSATGTSPSYQWQVSSDGGSSYTNVVNSAVYSGVTAPTLTLVAAPFALNNNLYRCMVSGLAPCGFVTSGPGILAVNPIPFAFTVTGGGSYCTGTNGVPVGVSQSAVGVNYQLILNGVNTGLPLAGTGGPLNFGNKTAPGIYTVTAYNVSTGCTQPMAGSVTIAVNPLPTVSLSVSPYKNLYPGLVTTLTATATSTANPITYFWFKNNTLINNTGSTLPVTIMNLGDYKVAITDANGCVNQSQVITIADSASSKFFIYPNPSSGQFTITYYNQGGLSSKQLVTIFSDKGERVYNNVFVVNLPYQFLNIDLRRHGAGIYYVVLSDETGKKIKTGEVLVR
jgi:hypothetical protein